MAKAEQRSPFAPAPLQDLPHYYGLLRPCTPRRYSRPHGWSRLLLLPSRLRRGRAQVLTFRTKAWSSFAPPTCRMPLGQSQASPELIPEDASPPGFDITFRFRHFCSGSLALASLDRACRNLVPAFPQRSPPRLLPAAACGGLRSAPDHRTRRALLHLSYSCAPQITHTALVTHDPFRTIGPAYKIGNSLQLLGAGERDAGKGTRP